MSKSKIPIVSNVAKVVSAVGKGDLKEAGKALTGGVLPPKVAQAVAPVVGFALGGPAGAAAASAATQFVTGSGKPLERLGNSVTSGITGYTLGSLASGLGAAGGQGFGALGSSLGLGGASAAGAGGLGSMGGQLLGSAFPTVGAAGSAGGIGALGGSFLGNAFPYVGAAPNMLGSTSLGTLGTLTNSIFGGGGQTVDAIAKGAGQLLGLGGGGTGILGGLGGQVTGMGGQQGGILSGLLGGGGIGGLSAQDLLIGGGSLASSIYGANVAEKAAKSQREAIDNAIASLRQGQEQARGNIQSAMADTNALIQRQNPITQQALDDANALLQQSQGVVNQGYDAAASTINPFYQAGTAGLGQLQQLAMGQGVPEFLATNPAYQFRQQEAQKALERSAAQRGGLLSGQFARALQERSQGLASEEFGNAFNRLSSVVGMGQQAGTQLAGLQTQRAGQLTGLLGSRAGLRERAGERFANTIAAQAENRARGGQLQAGIGQQFAGSLADLMRSRGDAVATGQVGQANAYNQGLANLTQYVTAPKYRFAGVGA